MRETLFIVGLLMLAVALRASRKNLGRKAGSLILLGTTYLLFFFISQSHAVGFLGTCLWLFIPWIGLLTQTRKQRMPLNNRLRHRDLPNPAFFPNAIEAAAAMEDAGFDHVTDCSWRWAGMCQHFRLFWHPEERAVAAVCLCEQDNVAFAFISVSSTDTSGNTWRTTNFPFSPSLRPLANLRWNHVPCEINCFHHILQRHGKFLSENKIQSSDLLMPDPDLLEDNIDQEMRDQVAYNLKEGIISMTPDGHFEYSTRGLLFLWAQSIKDMIRLC